MAASDKNPFEEAYKKRLDPIEHDIGLERHRSLKPNPYYRVYMIRDGKDLTFHMGNSITRIFTVDTLPDDLKQQLAMIAGMSKRGIPQYQDAAYDIGWRMSTEAEDVYVFVLPNERVLALRGEAVS